MEAVLDHKDQKKVKLDQIDHRILHDLQANGRITNVKLAENAGISAPPCLRRVRALEEDGFILGYHAEVDPTRLDFKEMFFALVGLSSQAQTVLQGFEDQVAHWAEVRECHMIRGGGDFLLRIVARDKEQRDALTMKLTSADNVIKVTTLETIRTSKNQPGVPIDIIQGDSDETE
jgi:DNA-binding Lrp family transcriptional regulator